MDHFNEQLEDSDRRLKLNFSPTTQIVLSNGQLFTGKLINRNIVFLYSVVTMSITT